MFQKVEDAQFITGEHEVLRFWQEQDIFGQLLRQNRGKPKWSFLDGPMTANNPMGVHHAWGRTYKDAYQRYFAMTGHELRYQNGFDCQGLWVEVEVEKELKLATKNAIKEFGIDKFVQECKKRVLRFAARQTEQSIRLGYWMQWDDPEELRKLAEAIGGEGAGGQGSGVRDETLNAQRSTLNDPATHHPLPTTHYKTANGTQVSGDPELITAQLGNPAWGGSYFTFSTNNNETIWKFLKKCFDRKKVYRGHDVMPWGGRSGSAYSQMEVADGRKLTTHRSCFVRFPLLREVDGSWLKVEGQDSSTLNPQPSTLNEYLLIWTTTPWTLTSNVAAAVNPDLEYVAVKAQIKGDTEPAIYYFAKDNLNTKRLEKEFKEGFGRPEWQWPEGVGKLKNIAQIFKEQGGYEELRTLKGAEMVGWRYEGPFDELPGQQMPGGNLQHRERDEETDSKDGNSASQDLADFALNWGSGKFTDTNWFSRIDSNFDRSTVPMKLVHALHDEMRRALVDDITSLLPGGLGRLESFKKVEISDWDDFFRRQLGFNLNSWEVLSAVIQFGSIFRLRTDEVSKSAALSACSDFVAAAYAFLGSISAAAHAVNYRAGVDAHRVIDGGRDSKGNANVVAGEGTGIVHIAPGCGDIDHKIGMELGLPVIAPLLEDGTYDEGFGIFTGKDAIHPSTADLVFEELKKKNLLVAVETYPHVYPHCWRTGDELVFRLVDEWFINMDWRDEIKEVTKCINWLPESINGQQRELEWLSIMSDWMVSKKRFWGLALPIWIEEDDPTKFVVFGSVAELKEWYDANGGEGWEKFEGHTPHRPWIDAVRIRNQSENKSGKWMRRIEDVGNPWLDAGIVPFSTLGYDEGSKVDGLGFKEGAASGLQPSTFNLQAASLSWRDWFPADLVTECFPGQFRNWFYSMLSLATMMRHDETDDPQEKKPFRNLLGHRLVMDENGNPMHKSDGTAIWFEEAAEQLGVDTLRWMYLAQNPAVDLRFGTRHKDQPVSLLTPDGPISQTKEGLPTCKVTSKPADEVRRQTLIPLWNSYAFFVNYAVLDGFVPPASGGCQPPDSVTAGEPTTETRRHGEPNSEITAARQEPRPPGNNPWALVAYSQRPEIDRWVLSRLQELIGTARSSFENFDAPNFMAAAAEFIDDLSNWYIRRNRRRFWKAVGASGGRESSDEMSADRGADTPRSPTWDTDKLSAYQTLYEVLLTLSKLLAPAVPFLSERMYRNLVGSREEGLGSRGENLTSQPSTFNFQPSTHRGADTPRSPGGPPASVHLCAYPEVDPSKLDPELNWATHQVQVLIRMAHRLRETAELRVRQPLAELRFASSDARQAAALEQYADIIADELNVKKISRSQNLDDLVTYAFKPNLKTLGPKYGKLLNVIKNGLAAVDPKLVAPLRTGQPVTVNFEGNEISLAPEDVMVSVQQASDWASADDAGIQIALSTKLTPELIREGMARDLIRHIQQLRKDADLEENQRIVVQWSLSEPQASASAVREVTSEWEQTILTETRSNEILGNAESPQHAKQVSLGEFDIALWMEIV